MNITSQYIANPKMSYAISINSIPTSVSKFRLNANREMLNQKIKPFRKMVFKVKDIAFNMICCPKGVITMGLDESELRRYDAPMSELSLKRIGHIRDSFLLGETEVTLDLYREVMG